MIFLKNILLACAGFRHYPNFLHVSTIRAVFHWVFLSAFLGLTGTYYFYFWFKETYAYQVKKISLFLPEFELRQGKISSQLPQPYYANTNHFTVILDLNKSIQNPEKIFPKGIVFWEDRYLFWVQDLKISDPYSKTGFPDGIINQAYLEKLGHDVSNLFPIFFIPIWGVFLIFGLALTLFSSVLIDSFERSSQPRLLFTEIFRIALYALTPGSLFLGIYMLGGLWELRLDLLFLGCYGLFFVMGLHQSRQSLLPLQEQNKSEDDETL